MRRSVTSAFVCCYDVCVCVDEQRPEILPFCMIIKHSIVMYIRVGTHCVLLAVAERKPVIGRETMAACLEVVGSTVGMGMIFAVCVWRACVCVCVCVYMHTPIA